jgi:hypothetical protein
MVGGAYTAYTGSALHFASFKLIHQLPTSAFRMDDRTLFDDSLQGNLDKCNLLQNIFPPQVSTALRRNEVHSELTFQEPSENARHDIYGHNRHVYSSLL